MTSLQCNEKLKTLITLRGAFQIVIMYMPSVSLLKFQMTHTTPECSKKFRKTFNVSTFGKKFRHLYAKMDNFFNDTAERINNSQSDGVIDILGEESIRKGRVEEKVLAFRVGKGPYKFIKIRATLKQVKRLVNENKMQEPNFDKISQLIQKNRSAIQTQRGQIQQLYAELKVEKQSFQKTITLNSQSRINIRNDICQYRSCLEETKQKISQLQRQVDKSLLTPSKAKSFKKRILQDITYLSGKLSLSLKLSPLNNFRAGIWSFNRQEVSQQLTLSLISNVLTVTRCGQKNQGFAWVIGSEPISHIHTTSFNLKVVKMQTQKTRAGIPFGIITEIGIKKESVFNEEVYMYNPIGTVWQECWRDSQMKGCQDRDVLTMLIETIHSSPQKESKVSWWKGEELIDEIRLEEGFFKKQKVYPVVYLYSNGDTVQLIEAHQKVNSSCGV